MENERKNKVLSSILVILGIIMSSGGILAMIYLWDLPKFDADGLLFGTIVGGLNIWIFGVLVGRKHHWDKKKVKNFLYFKGFLAVGLIGYLVTAFGRDILLIKKPSLSLNELCIYMLSGCLGLGISYLFQTRKGKSTD